MLNLKELKEIQKLLNEGTAFCFINKRLTKLELTKDFETLEIAKTLTKDSQIINELEKESNKDLQIITIKSSGNIIFKGEHKVLNKRLDRTTWEKVKHCFRFVDTKAINDDFYGEQFKGYEIINEVELKKILNF